MITHEVTSAEIAAMLRKAPALVWDPVAKRWVRLTVSTPVSK